MFIIYSFLTLSALLLSLFLFKCSIGSFNLNKINLNAFLFYKDILLMTLIGSVFVVSDFDLKNNFYFWGITGHVYELARLKGWLAIIYFIIAYPVGMILSNIVFENKFSSDRFILYREKSIIGNTKVFSIVSFVFNFIALLSLIYVYSKLKTIPWFLLFSGADASSLAISRTFAKINFEGSFFIKDMIMLKLPIILSYLNYILIKSNDTLINRFNFLLSTIIAFLSLTYSLEKAPLLFFLFGFLFLKVLLGETLKYKKIIYFALFVFFIIFIQLYLIMDFDSVGLILEKISIRIFIAQTAAVFQAFEFVPKYHDFIHPATLSGSVASVFGVEPMHYGRVLFSLYNYKDFSNGEAGYIVGNIVAESWMMFGYLGVVLLPIWVGFFVSSISHIIFKLPKHPVFIAIYAQIAITTSLNGGVAVFINIVSFLIPFIYGFMFLFSIFLFKLILVRR